MGRWREGGGGDGGVKGEMDGRGGGTAFLQTYPTHASEVGNNALRHSDTMTPDQCQGQWGGEGGNNALRHSDTMTPDQCQGQWGGEREGGRRREREDNALWYSDMTDTEIAQFATDWHLRTDGVFIALAPFSPRCLYRASEPKTQGGPDVTNVQSPET